MSSTRTHGILRAIFWVLVSIVACMGLLYVSFYVIDEYQIQVNGQYLVGIEGLYTFISGLVAGVTSLAFFGLIFFLISFAFPGSAMNHVICSRPKRLDFNDFFKKNIAGIRISRADDMFIIYEGIASKFMYTLFSVILTFFSATLFILWLDGDFLSFSSGYLTFLILITLIYFLKIIFRPVQKVVFDRMNGTVTLHGPLNGLFPKNTIPFSEVKVGLSYGSMVFQYTKYIHIGIPVWYEYNAETWYMLLQYMDKNYPLPRGNVFDPYREQDFKRRQSEGFPKPKCMSYVWLTDETCGYINASNAVKEKIKKFKKVDVFRAYQTVQEIVFSLSEKLMTQKHSEIALVGIYENNYVFKLFDDYHGEIVEYTKDMLSDCFLVSGMSKKSAEYIAQK